MVKEVQKIFLSLPSGKEEESEDLVSHNGEDSAPAREREPQVTFICLDSSGEEGDAK